MTARVVIVGLGDTGTLCAIHLSPHVEVVGISTKEGLVSGQELGMRLARPQEWSREYDVDYGRYRRLDKATIIRASVVGIDLGSRTIELVGPDDEHRVERFDVAIIATGARNGFWRNPDLQTAQAVKDQLSENHRRIRDAASVAVVGGGASAVSAAANIALGWPEKTVDLYFPHDTALTGHHRRTWSRVRRRLAAAGVRMHPGHRAVIPTGGPLDHIDSGTIEWTTGQSPATAEAIIWAIGRTQPNTGWLPADLLDDDGFVRVDADLRVPGHPNVFAVGDVAATDPLRSSARNRADRLVAHNVRAHLAGRRLREYRPPRRRWGSVLGPQPDGLEVFAPNGRAFRFPGWSIKTVLWPWIVHRGIYGGIRPEIDEQPRADN